MLALILSGCASIFNGGPRKIPVDSAPTGVTVSIYDRSGALISTQKTPFVAILPIKYKYFRGQSYRLVFEMPGYKKSETELHSTVSTWYLGNVIFGGLIGLIIVDPITGAMFNLDPEKIEQKLSPEATAMLHRDRGIMVIMKSQATENELKNMRPLAMAD